MNLGTDLQFAANIIKQGGLVIFPTETVYGIGVNGLDVNAIKKLYKVKNRSFDKPTSLLVSNMDMVHQIAKDINDVENQLMEKYFPGPLTIILKKNDIVPDIVTGNQDTVGVRMPSSEIARKLVEYANVPIATSSANVAGKPSGTNLEMILKDFEGKVDYIIDGGTCELGIASTIVKVIDGIPHVLRQGSLII